MKRMFQFVLAGTLVCVLSFGLSAQQVAMPMENASFGDGAPLPALTKTGPDQLLGQWSTGTKLPIPKKYHTVASYNGEIFVFAGVTTNNTYNNKCYKYTIATNTWTPIADFPLTRFLFGAAQTINGKIYISAGLDNLNTAYKTVPDMYEYNPATDSYLKKSNMPLPQAFCASGVIDGKIYYIAGSGVSNTAYIKTVQTYDPAADSWGTATDYPRDVRYIPGVTVSNKIVVSGGYNANYSPSRYIGDTYVGDMSGGTLRWTKVKDYPIGPTIYMSGAAAGNIAYFFGGRPSIDNNAPATQRSFSYNVATDTWTTLELKPTGMQAMLQAGTDGLRIYAPGGEGGDGSATPTDAMEILDANVSGAPALVLKKNSIDEWLKKGSSTAITFEMNNNGTAELTYSYTIEASATSWLSVDKASGSIASFSSATARFSINGASLQNGLTSATITLTTNDPANGTVSIPVQVHVQDQDIDEEMNVFVEEFSGTWCGWCPDGVDSLHVVKNTFGSRVNIATYHRGATSGGTYYPDAMETATGNRVITMLGVSGYPTAAFNRVRFPGQSGIPISRSIWISSTTNLLQTRRSPVNISLTNKTYDPGTKLLRFKLNVKFHRNLTGDYRVNVIVTEDGQNYAQVRYNPTRLVYPYIHENVAKLVYPDEYGMSIMSGGNATSQSVFTKDIEFTSPDSVAANSQLLVFVHQMNGTQPGEVIQSIKQGILLNTTAIGDVETAAGFSLSPAYPNPLTSEAQIGFTVPVLSDVQIVVTDMLGRRVAELLNGTVPAGDHVAHVNAGSLPAGMYQVTLRAGNFVQTRAMSVVR